MIFSVTCHPVKLMVLEDTPLYPVLSLSHSSHLATAPPHTNRNLSKPIWENDFNYTFHIQGGGGRNGKGTCFPGSSFTPNTLRHFSNLSNLIQLISFFVGFFSKDIEYLLHAYWLLWITYGGLCTVSFFFSWLFPKGFFQVNLLNIFCYINYKTLPSLNMLVRVL